MELTTVVAHVLNYIREGANNRPEEGLWTGLDAMLPTPFS